MTQSAIPKGTIKLESDGLKSVLRKLNFKSEMTRICGNKKCQVSAGEQ